MTSNEALKAITDNAVYEPAPALPKPRYRERLLTPLGWFILGTAALICILDLIVRNA